MGYLKDERAVYSPAVLNDLGLAEKDLNDIRDSIEDSIVGEVKQIVAACLASAPVSATGKTAAERGWSLNKLLALLDRMDSSLRKDESLSEEQRVDLMVDVQSLRSQLTKSSINPAILRILLQPLAEVDALGDLVSTASILLEKLS